MPEGPQSYRNFVPGIYARGTFNRRRRALPARLDRELSQNFDFARRRIKNYLVVKSEKREIRSFFFFFF